MSQEQTSIQHLRDSRNAELHPLQSISIDHTPNALPSTPMKTYRAGTPGSPPSATVIPSLMQNTASISLDFDYQSVSNFPLPLLDQYPNISSSHGHIGDMAKSAIDTRDELNFKYQSVTENKVRSSAASTPGALSPEISVQTEERRSRLPPNNAARKMPRKAENYSHSSRKKVYSAIKQPRAIQKVTPLRQNSPLEITSTPVFRNDTPKLTKSTPSRRQNTPLQIRANPAPSASRTRRVVLDEDDDIDLSWTSIEPSAATMNPSATAGNESSLPPTHSQPGAKFPIRGPRLRYEYSVPKDLEGVRKALGADNWKEYLVAMESLWLGDSDGKDFAAQTKRIFTMFDDRTRKKLNNKMAMEVVVPVLEGHMNEAVQGDKSELEWGLFS